MVIPEDFISGLDLCEEFYFRYVKPILHEDFPRLEYSCGLLGPGSDVLGFDDVLSQDHDWGPRLILFLRADDHKTLSPSIDRSLRQKLPADCLGYSTSFGEPDPIGVRLMKPAPAGEINHRIELATISGFFDYNLGVDMCKDLSAVDWLSFPQQVLLSIKSGRIFNDNLGLYDIRGKLNYYPHDIWLYMMASSWQRIGQEEHLAGRAMLTGQEVGFSILASGLMRDIMRLGFLLERKYAPYSKWLERAFKQLTCSATLMPFLEGAAKSADIGERQASLCRAFEVLASMHSGLRISEPVDSTCREFYGRGFQVIDGGRIATVLADTIESSDIRAIAERGLVGNIDQISDNTDVLEDRSMRRKLIEGLVPTPQP